MYLEGAEDSMKKCMMIFFVFTIMLFLSACEPNIDEQAVFEEFIEADSIYFECYMSVGQDETSEMKISTIKVCDQGIEIISKDLVGFIIDLEQEHIIYTDIFTNTRFFTDLSDLGITTSEEELNKLDLHNYFSNLEYGDNAVYGKLDLYSVMKMMGTTTIDTVKYDAIDMVVSISDGKVSEMKLDISSLGKSYKQTNAKLILKSIKYNDNIKLTKIKYANYNKLKTEDFIYRLTEDLYIYNSEYFWMYALTNQLEKLEPEPEKTPEIQYPVELVTEYYVFEGDAFEIQGEAYNGFYWEQLFEVEYEMRVTPEIDTNVIGLSTYEVEIDYEGHTFTEVISITVLERLDNPDIFNLCDEEIKNILTYENYAFVAGKTKLYKVNLDSMQLEGEVELNYKANSFYIQNGYLYVAANSLDDNVQISKDQLKGTISKIQFDTFTLVDQMNVDFAPYSIIVDKNNTIIVSKTQADISNYAIVDLENEEITQMNRGSNEDLLVYFPEKNAFLAISRDNSFNEEWYVYVNSEQAYNQHFYGNFNVKKAGYISYDGKIILDLRIEYGVCTFIHNDDTKNFVETEISYDCERLYYEKECKHVFYQNGNIYQFYQDYFATGGILIEYNIETGTLVKRYMDLQAQVTNMYIYDNTLYVAYSNDNNLYCYSLN